MKVVILCGGLGMRLREETEFRPKPLVAIGERPILWHIMKHYAGHGFTEFVLCLGYKGELIKRYFLDYHLKQSAVTVELGSPPAVEVHRQPDEAGWRITMVPTGALALTGARIKRIEPYIEEDNFHLTYGDGVADVDLTKLVEFHEQHGKAATVTSVFPPARFGELQTQGSQVTCFREKPQVQSGQISGGFFVLNRRVFDYIEDDDNCNFESGPLAALAGDGELMSREHEGFWQCMDTQRDLNLLRDMWASGKAPWKTW